MKSFLGRLFNNLSLKQRTANREMQYEKALELLFYEGQIVWQMNIMFIALNVGIGTIISSPLTGQFSQHRLLLGILSLFGLIINIAWLGTFRRNSKYYEFRMAQAREAEPDNWRLVKDRGQRFSEGDGVIIENKKYRLGCFGEFFSNKRAILISIWLFIIGFTMIGLAAIFYPFAKSCSSLAL